MTGSSASSQGQGLFALQGLPQPAAPGKKRKGAVAAANEPVLDSELAEQLAALCILSSSEISTVKAVVTEVLIFPADSPVAVATKKATSEYHAALKGMAAKDKAARGPPYVQVWQAILEAVITFADQHMEAKEMTKPIIDFVNVVKGFSTEQQKLSYITEVVRQCRVSQCHDKKKVKMEVSVKEGPTLETDHNPAPPCWLAVQRIMTKYMDAERKMGRAPRGTLERQLAQRFDFRTRREDN
eukprot:TRINITY_DN22046_c0_g2_i1.p2 TRINITY_DN22046_c0_g2~~TRINITY_DN22046_c0_g2_i1.p2  ORF type:complete len:241 (-),score=54.30 TRINITY_DN22046_c0_g2_i1:277-999(-)